MSSIDCASSLDGLPIINHSLEIISWLYILNIWFYQLKWLFKLINLSSFDLIFKNRPISSIKKYYFYRLM